MTKTWIVIANASRAMLCERNEKTKGLTELADFVHVESRQKASELGFDHPGHVEKGLGREGRGGTDLEPRTDPRHKEHERFARQLAAQLNEGVSSGACTRLVLIASNPFLGELKQHLSPVAAKLLWATAPHDLTALKGRELAERVNELLPTGA